MPVISRAEWEAFTSRHPDAHILQTAAWGELKSSFGWDAAWIEIGDCGAQVLFRQLPLGRSLAYIPKGPLGEASRWNALLPEIDQLCRSKGAVLLIVEPDLWQGAENKGADEPPVGFERGLVAVQPRRTIIVDLRADEPAILARMKQKTRYNIRLAEKRGVEIHATTDFALFHKMMTETGARDQFGVHSENYYQRAYELFHADQKCELLLATYREKPLAALMVFIHGKRAWYFYGASTELHRDLMPTYLLQWQAMTWAKARGCQEYDLWGVPNANEDDLESQFTQRSDGLWGVYRFKRGFGGSLRSAAGPWQRVYNPLLYSLYRWWVRRKQPDAA